MPVQRPQVRVLGALEVVVGGVPVSLGGLKQRAVLGALALVPGQVVSTSQLAEALWGEDVPARPNAVLQVYVSGLRRLLAGVPVTGGTPPVLVHRPPGYVLVLDEDGHDLSLFESLAAQGRRAADEGRLGDASRLLGGALALHRGPLLADLTELPWFDAERTRVEEDRLAVTELRLQLDLAAGREGDLVGELERLTALHPLRERLWELLIVAHYRSGRQADALRTYRRVRRLLQDELGVDPGPALRDLERFVLSQSAQLEAETRGRAFVLWTDVGGTPGLLTLDESTPVVTVGRRSDNDLALPGDRLVSRRHASLLFSQGQWLLRDEGSSNGTQLNGKPVTVTQPLHHGDVIRFGETPVVFRWPRGVAPTRSTADDATVRPTELGG